MYLSLVKKSWNVERRIGTWDWRSEEESVEEEGEAVRTGAER